jgi:hypothetical protein
LEVLLSRSPSAVKYKLQSLTLWLGHCLALASAWFRGLDIDCGCFGHAITSTSLPLALARSFTLGLVALYLLNRSCDSHDAVHSRNRA